MMDRGRLASKKVSKTEAVQAVMAQRLADENIHVGPSDYVPWLNDNKLCFLRLEGALFGNVPMNIEVRLSVEDSPNSAGVVIDAIRCCKARHGPRRRRCADWSFGIFLQNILPSSSPTMKPRG